MIIERMKVTGLRASDFLSEAEQNTLALALATEGVEQGRDPNEAASQAHIDQVLLWATQAVWRYRILREVLARGRGVLVAGGDVAVTADLAQQVLSEAMTQGIAPSART